MKLGTKVIHVGGEPDKETGSVMPPIYQTSTFAQLSPGNHKGYEYSRTKNPTRSRLEKCLAALENAEYSTATSSGVSAISLVIHSLPKGATILCSNDVYGGTYRLFTTVLNDFYNFVFIDTTNINEVKESLNEKIDLIWIESPTNPLLKLTDIKLISKLVSEQTKICVDNTFMSPIFQNPLDLGADIVVHSLTKYINGHSDVVAGAIMTNDSGMHEKFFKLQNSLGPVLSPFDSWLTLRGIKTLSIRMKVHESNAIEIANFLNCHSNVEKVLYPGLKTHPNHELAKSQMNGFGGMISILLKSDLAGTKRFLTNLNYFTLAESLGGIESLIEHPAIMTHASLPKKVRESIGIQDNLIRISVGIEDKLDLISDLDQALSKI